MKNKISPNFFIHEFVYPQMFKMFGDKAIRYFDKRLIDIAEALRSHYGQPVTVNNYFWGGQFSLSGLRPFDTATGATFSDHKYGRVNDFKIKNINPEEVRNEIRKNYKTKWQPIGVTAIEIDTPTWTHISTANFGSNTLVEIPFYKKSE
jgi:hypothetical protein